MDEEEDEEETPSILDAAEALEPESEKAVVETVTEKKATKKAPKAAEKKATKKAPKVAEKKVVESSAEEIDYTSMTVPQLKELLKAAGKPVSGKKSELIDRLNE
jgi:hypothetical protein